MNQEKRYLSEIIDIKRMQKDKFNLILSGVGTGKTYFCLNEDGLLKQLNEYLELSVQAHEILFITSRTIIVDQQNNDESNIGKKYDKEQLKRLKENNIGQGQVIKQIPIMTYNTFYHFLNEHSYFEIDRMINHLKLIIFDEAHAIIKDENFIKEMGRINEFIRSKLENKENRTYLVGMTATGDLIKEYFKVPINELLDHPLHNYSADKVYVASSLEVYPLLVEFGGNALIMVNTVNKAYELQRKFGDKAQILVSQFNPCYSEKMEELRAYIVQNNALPKECQILITTSCMREGINILADKTKIENVVCFDVSTTSVIQFMGRYRGDISRLVLVNSATHLGYRLPMEKVEYEEFVELSQGKQDGGKYLKRLEPVLRHGCQTEVIRNAGIACKYNLLDQFIKEKWLYKIIVSEQQKKELVDFVNDIGIRDDKGNKVTFIKVIKLIESRGFHVLHKSGIRVKKAMRDIISYVDFTGISKISPYTIMDK